MFVEEWQFLETPFFEPLKSFKDVPLDEGEVDFFNFETQNNAHNNTEFNNENSNYNNYSSSAFVEGWGQLPTPESEASSGYAPLVDNSSIAGPQMEFPALRDPVTNILDQGQMVPATVSSASTMATPSFTAFEGLVPQPLDQENEYEQVLEEEQRAGEQRAEEQRAEERRAEAQRPVVPRSVTMPQYVKQPRQNRYSGNSPPKSRKVSDSRLSAQGLAEVLKLDSPDEALKRERFILDIFETELHYPLGYKTWVRDTTKDYRHKLIDQLYDRVRETYPEYDRSVLETIIRRATYYMMQSRLRRERRAKAKSRRESASSA